MAMDKHKFRMICKTSHHYLRNIGNIRKILDQGSAKTLVHSFVTSMINYCNALLFGLPKYQSIRLQLAGGFNKHRRHASTTLLREVAYFFCERRSNYDVLIKSQTKTISQNINENAIMMFFLINKEPPSLWYPLVSWLCERCISVNF